MELKSIPTRKLGDNNRTMDTVRSITRSAAHFFSGTMLSRLSGMMRDVLMAAAFGGHPSIAAFFMAFRFANLPRRLLAEGALQSALVPRFEALRAHNAGRASAFIRDLATAQCLFVGCLLLVVEIVLALLAPTLTPEIREVVRLTQFVLPAVMFIALFGISASVLQCEKQFFTSSAAPVLFNAVWIGAVLIAWKFPCEQAVFLLAPAMVLAFCVQWVATLPATWKVLRAAASVPFWRKAHPLSEDVKSLFRPIAFGIVGVGAQQVISALDAIFARIADPSGPAFLWYALRLQQLPLALFGIALAGAALPPLARAVKADNRDQYRHLLTFVLEKAGTLMVLCTIAIVAVGPPAVNLIYGHGAFSPGAVLETADCLRAYGLGLLPQTWIFILAGACYAHEEYRWPALISAGAVLLNIGLDGFLVLRWDMGSKAIALATATTAWIQLGALVVFMHHKKWGSKPRDILLAVGRSLAAGLAGWIAAHAVAAFCNSDLTRELKSQLTTLAVQCTAFALTWLGVAFLLGERLQWLGRVRQEVANDSHIDGQ